jgi:hypothetical protein
MQITQEVQMEGRLVHASKISTFLQIVAFFADLAECIFSTIQVDKLRNRDDSD